LTSFDQGSIHSFYVNQPVVWRAGKAFMLPAQTQKALAPLCNRSGKLEAVAKRVSVVDENGVVPGDLRPATDAALLFGRSQIWCPVKTIVRDRLAGEEGVSVDINAGYQTAFVGTPPGAGTLPQFGLHSD
jgi:hypothetical protein